MFFSTFLSLKPVYFTPEIALLAQNKVQELYGDIPPQYYKKENPQSFKVSQKQLLCLLDFIQIQTKARYAIFGIYQQKTLQLNEARSELDKEACLHWAKKNLEESLWFICNYSIKAVRVADFIVDKCATGAASNLDLALRHFSTTDFDAASHTSKESLVRALTQDYVKLKKLCPIEGNEVHYVNAYFNYLASSYGCKEQIDDFALPSPSLEHLNGVSTYVKKNFRLDSFLSILHTLLPELPLESFDASNSKIYSCIKAYAAFIKSSINDTELETQLYNLYDREENETVINGETQYAIRMTPKTEFHSLLNALLVAELERREVIASAKLVFEDRDYLFNGKIFLTVQEGTAYQSPYALLGAEEQRQLQAELSLRILEKENKLKNCPFSKITLIRMLDAVELIALYQKASDLKNLALAQDCFFEIMQQEPIYPLFFRAILKNKNQNPAHLHQFAAHLLSHPNSFEEEALEILIGYLDPQKLPTCLLEVCKNNMVLSLELILKSTLTHFNLNQKIDKAGNTLLSIVANKGHLEIFKMLLAKDAAFEQANDKGITPLGYAAYNGHIAIMKELIARDAFVNHRGLEGGTPLTFSAFKGQVEAIKILLDKGADPNLKTNTGLTAAWLAAQQGHLEALQVLIENGVDLNQAIDNGASLLWVAAQNGHTKIIEFLLIKGASINQGNNKKVTPLWVAAEKGHVETLKILLDYGADIHQKIEPQGVSALGVAAQNGRTKVIEILLEKGAEIDEADNKGVTPLGIAIYQNQLEAAKMLLEKGANINHATQLGLTALWSTVERGQIAAFNLLLAHDADPNLSNNSGITPLWVAAEKNRLPFLKLLLEKKAAINQANHNGVSPLWVAAQNGHVEIIKILLENKADPDQANTDNMTPFLIATQNGHIEVMKLLLEKGIDPHHRDDKGISALFLAAQKGQVKIIKFLLDLGAKINQTSTKGTTALSAAAREGHVEAMKILLEAGADPHLASQEGITPLLASAYEGRVDALNFLLEAGLYLNQGNQEGITPLFYAAQRAQIETVQFLLAKRASINQQTLNGSTALWVASYKGHTEIIKILLENGAAINQIKNDGSSPLCVAARKGHTEVVRLLIEKGADLERAKYKGASPLFIAAQNGHELVVKELLRAGADPHYCLIKSTRDLLEFTKKHRPEIQERMRAFIKTQKKRPMLYIQAHEIAEIMGYKEIYSCIKSYLTNNSLFCGQTALSALDSSKTLSLEDSFRNRPEHNTIKEHFQFCHKYFKPNSSKVGLNPSFRENTQEQNTARMGSTSLG